jgi:choline kinase
VTGLMSFAEVHAAHPWDEVLSSVQAKTDADVLRALARAEADTADLEDFKALISPAAAPHLDGPFLLLMSDHLFDPGIARGLMAHSQGRAGLTLAVDRRLANPLVDMDDVTRVETDPGGAIRRIGKGITPFDAFDTGIFVAPLSLVDAIRSDVAASGTGSLSAGVQGLAAAGQAFTYDIGDRFWLDVDDAVAFGHAEREEAQAGSRS